MLNKFHEKQQGMELIILEQLVPQDHLLRKIDRSIDFSFIRRLCAPLYSANLGRPAIEPEVLFRMLFVGYLYGIRSERRLEEEINYNMAYKWFCGLNLTEKAPDATTLSVNRKRRFRDNNIPEQIFDEILRQAIAHNDPRLPQRLKKQFGRLEQIRNPFPSDTEISCRIFPELSGRCLIDDF